MRTYEKWFSNLSYIVPDNQSHTPNLSSLESDAVYGTSPGQPSQRRLLLNRHVTSYYKINCNPVHLLRHERGNQLPGEEEVQGEDGEASSRIRKLNNSRFKYGTRLGGR